MERRKFIKRSILAGAIASTLPQLGLAAHTAKQKKTKPEFYELRVYTFKNKAQQKLVEDYFEQAAIPALNKLGVKNIGVFTEQQPEGQTKLFVVIPYKSLEDFVEIPAKLAKDPAYNMKGAPYLNADPKEPAYERIESSLMKSFAYMPKMELPEKKNRMFELRRYESHSENAGQKKIEMFNEGGEIAIFKRVGLTPVFFGETIIGEMRPNLTYMLTFDDMPEHDKNWKQFISDPEWKTISSKPEYANSKIVSKITRTFLVPTDFSQI